MPRNGSGVFSAPAGTLAVTLTTIKSPEYNAFVNDLVADANAARPIVAGGTGGTSVATAQTALSVVGYNSQTLTATQQAQARSNISAPLFGHLYGLTLSNNATDATNDIDIAVGEAASTETNPVLMVLASVLTKRLDAAWAVGSGNGGLDTGSIANAWYYVWLIQRSDTGVVDALFSLSSTAPTMPASYDRKRRIGAVLRASASLQAFFQNGDNFDWAVATSDIAVTNPGTIGVNRVISAPPGVYARVQYLVTNLDAGTVSNFYLFRTDITTLPKPTAIAQNASGRQQQGAGTLIVKTDGSSQVRTVASYSSANVIIALGVDGWVDTRGRV